MTKYQYRVQRSNIKKDTIKFKDITHLKTTHDNLKKNETSEI